MKRHERAQISAEVGSAWRESGIEAEPSRDMPTTPEAKWLREQATGIIQGDLNSEELASLTPELTKKLSKTTRKLIALTTTPSIRQLEVVNPRFSAFQAKVVKDMADGVDDPT
jgi:hypothetical protein